MNKVRTNRYRIDFIPLAIPPMPATKKAVAGQKLKKYLHNVVRKAIG